MRRNKYIGIFIFLLVQPLFNYAQDQLSIVDSIPFIVYPEVMDTIPNLPSPFTTRNGGEFVVAVTKENKYAIIDVTLSNDRDICPQLIVDSIDFPHLARTGLHSVERLNNIQAITGRSLSKITELARPNGLSQAGFMAHDEHIIAVLKGDNQMVQSLGLKHPQLAKPLFHVLNMMDIDLSLNRWNMNHHRWENIQYFYYNQEKVYVEAEDTKGGQKSIFNDDIQGGFYIKLWRAFNSEEVQYLNEVYGYLSESELNELKQKLRTINTGEIQPQYIMRYGFYEGHTFWRTDPIAISFIFGLKSLEELDKLFEKRLLEVLTCHFVE
jgi:hypothetical protein